MTYNVFGGTLYPYLSPDTPAMMEWCVQLYGIEQCMVLVPLEITNC